MSGKVFERSMFLHFLCVKDLKIGDFGFNVNDLRKFHSIWSTPWKMNGWNLQITHLEKTLIFQTSMIMFHVNLQGCTPKICGESLVLHLLTTQLVQKNVMIL